MKRAGFVTALAAFAAAPVSHPAWAQESAGIQEPVGVRSVLAAEIAGLEGDVAALEDLAAWQNEMIRAASSDPATTLRQRRPMSECRASPLAPVCASLAALFREDAPLDTGGKAGAAGSTTEPEGSP